MIERRNTVRFEPSSNDGEAVLDVGGTSLEGVVSDLSPREVTPLFRTALGESVTTESYRGGVEKFLT